MLCKVERKLQRLHYVLLAERTLELLAEDSEKRWTLMTFWSFAALLPWHKCKHTILGVFASYSGKMLSSINVMTSGSADQLRFSKFVWGLQWYHFSLEPKPQFSNLHKRLIVVALAHPPSEVQYPRKVLRRKLPIKGKSTTHILESNKNLSKPRTKMHVEN